MTHRLCRTPAGGGVHYRTSILAKLSKQKEGQCTTIPLATVIVCYLLTVVGSLVGNCALKSGPLSYDMKRSLFPGPWSLCVD